MNREPDKVEETAATYAAKPAAQAKTTTPKPAEPGVRYAEVQAVRKNNEKLMQVHRKVLQKLAQ